MNLVMNTMSETQIKGGGAGAQLLPGMEDRTSAKEASNSEQINVCPECGGSLRFGSRDPLESDFWWCRECGYGPILFPIGEGPRNPKPANIDVAEAKQRAALIRDHAVVR